MKAQVTLLATVTIYQGEIRITLYGQEDGQFYKDGKNTADETKSITVYEHFVFETRAYVKCDMNSHPLFFQNLFNRFIQI